MSEVFFIEHKNTQIEVDLGEDDRIRLSLRDMDLYLSPSEASHIADMLTKIFQWDDDSEAETYEDEDGFKGEGIAWASDEDEPSPHW
jgi:hypothetical protein